MHFRFLWFTVSRFCCCSGSALVSERSGWVRSKDLIIFTEDEFYCLVLINHINGHVRTVALWTHQSWSKDDADVLRCHAITIRVLHHPVATGNKILCECMCGWECNKDTGAKEGVNPSVWGFFFLKMPFPLNHRSSQQLLRTSTLKRKRGTGKKGRRGSRSDGTGVGVPSNRWHIEVSQDGE